tara:strand:- start:802 stop:1041 length:240 start_codon:yes stop_codon:yes gene_type:complete
MTEEEIIDAINNAKTPQDYRDLYKKVFGEEPEPNSSNWYELEEDIIIDALVSGKKIPKERRKNILFSLVGLISLLIFSP